MTSDAIGKIFEAGVQACGSNKVKDMTFIIFDEHGVEFARRVFGKAKMGPVVFSQTATAKAKCMVKGKKLWARFVPFIACCLFPCLVCCGCDLPVIGAKWFVKGSKKYILAASGTGG